jgi:phosphoserine/homoserine phosphotransferase
MYVVCLDLEGVLIPEIWINFAHATGIEELRLTTRDIPDYDVLMKKRLGILADHNLKLGDIQKVIGTMEPLEGARDFLDDLRSQTQVVILSDTFTQFARPMMEKLAWPTLFCNSLVVDEQDRVVDYRLRQKDGKRKAVEGFQSMGFRVIAAGDSYNDLTMIRKAEKGILFCPPDNIIAENPDLPVARNYGQFKEHLHRQLAED